MTHYREVDKVKKGSALWIDGSQKKSPTNLEQVKYISLRQGEFFKLLYNLEISSKVGNRPNLQYCKKVVLKIHISFWLLKSKTPLSKLNSKCLSKLLELLKNISYLNLPNYLICLNYRNWSRDRRKRTHWEEQAKQN